MTIAELEEKNITELSRIARSLLGHGDNYFGRNDDAEFVKVKSELYLEITYGQPPNHYDRIRAGGARAGLRSLRGRGAIAARRRGSPQTRSCSCTTGRA